MCLPCLLSHQVHLEYPSMLSTTIYSLHHHEHPLTTFLCHRWQEQKAQNGHHSKKPQVKVNTWSKRNCYVRVERSAWLELAGYDRVALPVVNGVSASGTQWEHWDYGSMGDMWWRGRGSYPRRTRWFRGSLWFLRNELDWHKNSDLGSEVGTDIGLNSTTLCL